ncbi:MAG: hypothetical protein JWL90_4697, partial [Chthoniobacteraceae bacterium]|nr:hypothetical protein [Chthoniobacteraceae bacterium]
NKRGTGSNRKRAQSHSSPKRFKFCFARSVVRLESRRSAGQSVVRTTVIAKRGFKEEGEGTSWRGKSADLARFPYKIALGGQMHRDTRREFASLIHQRQLQRIRTPNHLDVRIINATSNRDLAWLAGLRFPSPRCCLRPCLQPRYACPDSGPSTFGFFPEKSSTSSRTEESLAVGPKRGTDFQE